MITLGQMHAHGAVADAEARVNELLARYDSLDVARGRSDRIEERPFVEWGLVDLGGES